MLNEKLILKEDTHNNWEKLAFVRSYFFISMPGSGMLHCQIRSFFFHWPYNLVETKNTWTARTIVMGNYVECSAFSRKPIQISTSTRLWAFLFNSLRYSTNSTRKPNPPFPIVLARLNTLARKPLALRNHHGITN